ncbi:Uncharacterised protein [Streptomyces griseus]|nr:Uncharacterised protein [Streptomyces griseus]
MSSSRWRRCSSRSSSWYLRFSSFSSLIFSFSSSSFSFSYSSPAVLVDLGSGTFSVKSSESERNWLFSFDWTSRAGVTSISSTALLQMSTALSPTFAQFAMSLRSP